MKGISVPSLHVMLSADKDERDDGKNRNSSTGNVDLLPLKLMACILSIGASKIARKMEPTSRPQFATDNTER